MRRTMQTGSAPRLTHCSSALVRSRSPRRSSGRSSHLSFRMNMFKLREEREMKPATFGHMVSAMLYEKRFGPYFVEPVVAGLDADGKPFITAMDLIGA